MSYKCSICESVQAKGTPLRRYTVRRDNDGSILQEMPVCRSCELELGAKPVYQVMEERKPKPVMIEVKPLKPERIELRAVVANAEERLGKLASRVSVKRGYKIKRKTPVEVTPMAASPLRNKPILWGRELASAGKK